jgi:uncharacterized protein YigE (DUF2233 family)
MIRLAALLALLPALPAAADICRPVEHRERAFTVCTVDLSVADARLALTASDGRPVGDFRRLAAEVEARGEGPLLLATNAGMYHPDRSPVGHYVESGEMLRGVVTSAGPGNFGMLPNGVLCLAPGRAAVVESRAFAAAAPRCAHATQSGPMLLIDGAVHPRFIPDSTYRNVRNGAAASPDGRLLHLAISDEPVTFDELATLFRDVLGARDALYLDGAISRLHVDGRSDGGRMMGPILYVVPRAPPQGGDG